jgi:type IV fimbrial biogenesis protein FimT
MDHQEGHGLLMKTASASRGFSIIELMVAVALLALLLGMAAPAFGTWIRNAQTRTVTEALLNGARLAQAEAGRRQRQVVFFRTASNNCDNTVMADTGGTNWVIRTVPIVAGDAVQTVQCGQLAEAGDGVAITGATALCFSGIGRLSANADPGIGGATCTIPSTTLTSYIVSHPQGNRNLRVQISIAGYARMCDPARALSTAVDGC